MSKVAIVGYARTASGRLPNKVIYDLGGKPAFVQMIERATHYIDADHVVVACTKDSRDDPIELLANHYGIDCFRGAQGVVHRCLLLADKLGVGEDDWWIGIHCDQALMLSAWLPWAIKQAEEHNCDWIYPEIPSGTLVAAFWAMSCIARWGRQRRVWETVSIVDQVADTTYELDAFHLGAKRYLIVNFPAEYLIPWPWGPLLLDHPVQALVVKEIYRQLYRGKPIDAFDVRRLFLKEPRLAQMIPLSLPLSNRPMLQASEQGPILANIRLNAECVEVTWKGDQKEVMSHKLDEKPEGRTTSQR